MSEYWTFPKCTFQETHVFSSGDIGQAGFELSECGHVGGILLFLGNLELLHFHVARSRLKALLQNKEINMGVTRIYICSTAFVSYCLPIPLCPFALSRKMTQWSVFEHTITARILESCLYKRSHKTSYLHLICDTVL